MDETESRLTKLERHVAEMEYLYEQLSKVVAEQGDLLRKLQVQNQRFATTIEAGELERIKGTPQKPPHYQ
jgi:uncharacterized coiled-coil protein SlyX